MYFNKADLFLIKSYKRVGGVGEGIKDVLLPGTTSFVSILQIKNILHLNPR